VRHHVFVRQHHPAGRIERERPDQAAQHSALELLLVHVQRGRPVLDHHPLVLPVGQPARGLVVPAGAEVGIAWKDEPHHVVEIRVSQPPDDGGFQYVVRRRGHRAECAHLARDESPGLQRLEPQHVGGRF
jgi:hypothetical protein